jgi:homocysteine S-methyltransferase
MGKKQELPHFAAISLMRSSAGRDVLRQYYERYISIATAAAATATHTKKFGFLVESPTWRASADWGAALGWTAKELTEAVREAVVLVRELKEKTQSSSNIPILVSGNVGPRGDGYVASAVPMSVEEAEAYHAVQVGCMAEAGADIISAFTMTTAAEAAGIAWAAARHNKECVISFTVETNGRLPDGQALLRAIAQVDNALDQRGARRPCYYMINCAHPTHFASEMLLSGDEQKNPATSSSVNRIRGLRANSSCKSHAELNEATELDRGNAVELATQYVSLLQTNTLPNLRVLGGCCGTDHTHVAALAAAFSAL